MGRTHSTKQMGKIPTFCRAITFYKVFITNLNSRFIPGGFYGEALFYLRLLVAQGGFKLYFNSQITKTVVRN